MHVCTMFGVFVTRLFTHVTLGITLFSFKLKEIQAFLTCFQ